MPRAGVEQHTDDVVRPAVNIRDAEPMKCFYGKQRAEGVA